MFEVIILWSTRKFHEIEIFFLPIITQSPKWLQLTKKYTIRKFSLHYFYCIKVKLKP